MSKGDHGVGIPDSNYRGSCWAVVKYGWGATNTGLKNCSFGARKDNLTCTKHADREEEAQQLKALREGKHS